MFVLGSGASLQLDAAQFSFGFLGSKYEVEVESGLDEKKGLEILSLYTDTKPHALPEEARCIVRECKGTGIHRTTFQKHSAI